MLNERGDKKHNQEINWERDKERETYGERKAALSGN